MNARTLCVVTLAALVALVAPASAGESSKAEAIRRLKELQPTIAQVKSQGLIGEVYTGYLDAVKDPDAATKELIAEVNKLRRVIYKDIADKHGITVERAALAGGIKNFKDAKPGEYLKDRDGKWKQKQ
jgi:hypothetical protein